MNVTTSQLKIVKRLSYVYGSERWCLGVFGGFKDVDCKMLCKYSFSLACQAEIFAFDLTVYLH